MVGGAFLDGRGEEEEEEEKGKARKTLPDVLSLYNPAVEEVDS